MTTILGSLNPLWTSTYDDPDVAAYGETPSAQEWELRAGATPAGSGALVQKRTSVTQIALAFRTGELVDALTTTTGTTPDANTAAAVYSATEPTGYSGNHLEVQATGAVSTTRGVRKACSAGVKDLSVYGGGTRLLLNWRVTSVTNLTRWGIRFEFATTNDWAEFTLAVAASAINTWLTLDTAKDVPVATNGTVDWSLWSGNVKFMVTCSGVYTGNLEVADLRIGAVRTGKTVPDGDLAPESTYDSRVRYRDNADPKASTTLAANSSAAATNIKVTATAGMAVGDWITIASAGFVETRLVTLVGTAGAGGTGITVSEGFTYAHTSADAVAVYYWGPWTNWLTVKATLPPVIVGTSPADTSTVTDPTPDFVHTFTDPASKAQTSHTLRVYLRNTDGDALVWQKATSDAGLTDTGPDFLLNTGLTYAWEIAATNTDGISATSPRLSFTTNFTTTTAPTTPTATQDTDASGIILAWGAVAGNDHYRVYWVAADGSWIRVDGGPAILGDGLPLLTATTFEFYGGRHGINEFYITSDNGAASADESPAAYVSVTLDPIVNGQNGECSFVLDGIPGFTFPAMASGLSRDRRAGIETFTPPGRGKPVHLNWRNAGRALSATFDYLPSEGDLVTVLEQLENAATPFWFKPPRGYAWDPLRAVIAGLQDQAQHDGFATVSVDLDESE